MIILLNSDILELCFDFKNISDKKNVFDLVYNSSTDVCFTKQYIELLEKTITNKEAFEALIIELTDTNRIKIEVTDKKNNLREEFVEIYRKSKAPSLLPIVYTDESNILNEISSLIIISKALPISRHWIALELLSKNYCNVSYQNFNKDSEIYDAPLKKGR